MSDHHTDMFLFQFCYKRITLTFKGTHTILDQKGMKVIYAVLSPVSSYAGAKVPGGEQSWIRAVVCVCFVFAAPTHITYAPARGVMNIKCHARTLNDMPHGA